MGILSVLGKIGGSLLGLGGVMGKQQEGAAKGAATQAQLQQGQDRNAVDLYQTQQGAQNQAGQLDLQRKSYDTSSRSAAGKQALLAMLMGDYHPSTVSVPGITNATFSGGMGESLKNPQILALLKSIADKGVTDQATPNAFTGGEMVKAPTLTPLPQTGKGSSIMSTLARIAQIGGSVSPYLPAAKPKSGPSQYGDMP